MALQGTIRDFGLGDIFQLIGIQRKTGMLTLRNEQDVVSIKFSEGRVVGADTASHSMEDLLGGVLVRTGRITEAQLEETLKLQKRTLQRLGYLLVKSNLISEDDLIEALRVQSLQIVYRLFRWRTGSYEFQTADELEYDERHFVPISAESILMEGARMIDEWPIIERRIKSDRMVFRRTEAAEGLDLTVDSIVDSDLDFDFGFEGAANRDTAEKEKTEEIKLSPEEREILKMVDGRLTVEEINDRSALGEFDTCRILAELLTRNLIEEVKRVAAVEVTGRASAAWQFMLRLVLAVVLLAIVAGSVVTLDANPFAPWKLVGRSEVGDRLRLHASQTRLERIDDAIQVFYLDAGAFPPDLEVLAANGYIRQEDLLDPWQRPYGLRITPGGYQIFGLDSAGEESRDLIVSHPFTGMQRMMTARAAEAAP